MSKSSVAPIQKTILLTWDSRHKLPIRFTAELYKNTEKIKKFRQCVTRTQIADILKEQTFRWLISSTSIPFTENPRNVYGISYITMFALIWIYYNYHKPNTTPNVVISNIISNNTDVEQIAQKLLRYSFRGEISDLAQIFNVEASVCSV